MDTDPRTNFDGPACGMCTTIVIFGLIVAAVLTVPALARMIGAVVLILLALTALACAEERRPLPVPQGGAGCPPGYSSSPTSGACIPDPHHAVPRISLADRELPDRVDLLADVAHVRRGRVLRSLS
jgi:hypothetical protein